MSKLPTLSQTVNTVVSMTAFIVLATVTTTPAVAALFNFKFDGTLTGSDPFGTAATVFGALVLTFYAAILFFNT